MSMSLFAQDLLQEFKNELIQNKLYEAKVGRITVSRTDRSELCSQGAEEDGTIYSSVSQIIGFSSKDKKYIVLKKEKKVKCNGEIENDTSVSYHDKGDLESFDELSNYNISKNSSEYLFTSKNGPQVKLSIKISQDNIKIISSERRNGAIINSNALFYTSNSLIVDLKEIDELLVDIKN